VGAVMAAKNDFILQSCNKAARMNDIDILKGIGIILMVIGHMHYWPAFNKFIFGFHMPLFFWISGYLYRKPNDLLTYIRRKARTLLVPYFTVGLGYSLIDWARSKWDFKQLMFDLKGVLVKTTYDLPVESALWFLFALFWVELMYAALDIVVRNRRIQAVVIVAVTIIGCCWTRWFHYLPWGINSAMSALGFFALGCQFRRQDSQSSRAVCKTTPKMVKFGEGGGNRYMLWYTHHAEQQP